jgi:selenocysteine lyase/cysteine desulfurase
MSALPNPTPALPLRVPDPREDDVPDLELAGSHAAAAADALAESAATWASRGVRAWGGRVVGDVGRDVVVDYRPGAGIRMSPHFYTTDEEIDSAFAAIDEIRASGEWRRWKNQPVVVT